MPATESAQPLAQPADVAYMRVLSLTNDVVFKEFLERELPLLRSLLGAVLGEEVAELTLINNELWYACGRVSSAPAPTKSATLSR